MSRSRDVVLVTIDCWRHDAPPEMDTLAARTGAYERTEAICQAPATRGAFPAMLAGRHYPRTYDGYASVRDDVDPLPAVLSDEGYETAAVVGSNPYLSAWRPYFDHFWNDGMDPTSDDEGALEDVRASVSKLRNGMDYLRLRSRVTASEVAARASRWYENATGPRFLWMHLMDVHVPFLPGLRRGLREGLLDTYRAHLEFMRDPAGTAPEHRRTLERLYWRSVDRLDEQIGAVLDVFDDAHVAIVGDHGEEFDHDGYGHARLYDECIRVPLVLSPGLSSAAGDDRPLRHLDLPATILAALGVDAPDSWTVSTPGQDAARTFALNHSPQYGRAYAAVRTDQFKLIKTLSESTLEQTGVEAYDLRSDPGETNDVYGEETALEPLEAALDAFLAEPDVRSGILERPDEQSAVVEDRLKALGYR